MIAWKKGDRLALSPSGRPGTVLEDAELGAVVRVEWDDRLGPARCSPAGLSRPEDVRPWDEHSGERFVSTAGPAKKRPGSGKCRRTGSLFFKGAEVSVDCRGKRSRGGAPVGPVRVRTFDRDGLRDVHEHDDLYGKACRQTLRMNLEFATAAYPLWWDAWAITDAGAERVAFGDPFGLLDRGRP